VNLFTELRLSVFAELFVSGVRVAGFAVFGSGRTRLPALSLRSLRAAGRAFFAPLTEPCVSAIRYQSLSQQGENGLHQKVFGQTVSTVPAGSPPKSGRRTGFFIVFLRGFAPRVGQEK
jgi:hypothetical protein